jgi:class 3 adenylate cyclase
MARSPSPSRSGPLAITTSHVRDVIQRLRHHRLSPTLACPTSTAPAQGRDDHIIAFPYREYPFRPSDVRSAEPPASAPLAWNSRRPRDIPSVIAGTPPAMEAARLLTTLLFTDIVNSTRWATELGDRRWRLLLDRHDALVKPAIERCHGRVVKTTGDGFLATFDSPGRAVQAVCAVRDAVRACGMEMRAGLHSGEVEVRGDDIAGIAVHIAQRVGCLAEPGEILATSTLKDLVLGSGLPFTDRGVHTLRGVPGDWRLFATAKQQRVVGEPKEHAAVDGRVRHHLRVRPRAR